VKKIITVLVTILIIGLQSDNASTAFSQLPAKAPGKRALLVGISKYTTSKKRVSNWSNLNTDADVNHLRQMLITKFGFERSNIKVLRLEAETTKTAIIDAFRQHLIEKTSPGDIVYFHFSGHGQQVPDDNNDEIDGYDETIVPSDYISTTDGGNNIRDDELIKLLEKLSEKRPANVTITFDSCYSGTALRGNQTIRGGPPAKAPVSKLSAKQDLTINEDSPSSLNSTLLKGEQNYVFISATNQSQLARETVNEANEAMGLFTWALIKAFGTAGPQTSYRDLIDQIRLLVNADYNGNQVRNNQDPQVEGKLDLKVLGETALKPEPFFTLTVKTNGVVTIPAGKLLGMTVGSRFSIHPSSTKSTAEKNQITTATIEQVEALESILNISGGGTLRNFAGARAFETEHNYGDTVLRVAYGNLAPVEKSNDLVKEIRNFDPQPIKVKTIAVNRGNVKENYDVIKERYDVLITQPTLEDKLDGVVPADFNGLIIQRQNGSLIEKIDAGEKNIVTEVRSVLENEARRRLIVTLENTDPNISISLRIIPVRYEVDPVTKVRKVIDVGIRRDSSGLMMLKKGDHLRLEVKNCGLMNAYITILNVLGNGRIGPAYPQVSQQGTMSDDYNLFKNDGKWHRLPDDYIFVIDDVAGRESFKAIATSQPSDFSPLIDPTLLRGPESQSINDKTKSPLYRRLSKIGKTRSSIEKMDAPKAWATATAEFEISDKLF
jgi:hypothetical protein